MAKQMMFDEEARRKVPDGHPEAGGRGEGHARAQRAAT
jgi:hypothetical protein